MRVTLIKILSLAACFLLAVGSLNLGRYLAEPDAPEILPPSSFTASSPAVAPGQAATLEWDVPGDLNITIHGEDTADGRFEIWHWPPQGGGDDVARGQLSVTPEHTTVYTLKAWRSPENVTELQAEVTVTVPEPRPEASELLRRRAARLRRQAEETNEGWEKFAQAIKEVEDAADRAERDEAEMRAFERMRGMELDYPRLDDIVNAKGQVR